LTENAGHEFDEREIGEQDIIGLSFGNKLHYNAVRNSLKKRQNTSHNSKISCIICICIMIKSIYYEYILRKPSI